MYQCGEKKQALRLNPKCLLQINQFYSAKPTYILCGIRNEVV